MTIAMRFAVASAALCALTVLLAGIGYWQITSLRASVDEIPELLKVRIAIAEWQGETETNAARTIAILRSSDAALGGLLSGDMKVTSARISEHQKAIEGLQLDDGLRKQFAEIG